MYTGTMISDLMQMVEHVEEKAAVEVDMPSLLAPLYMAPVPAWEEMNSHSVQMGAA